MENKENNLGGRPSKLSARDKQSIVRQIKSGSLKMQLRLLNSLMALSPTLSHPKQSEIALKEKRILLCYKEENSSSQTSPSHTPPPVCKNIMKNWTVEDWKRVLWTDETKSIRIGSDGKAYIWKKRENTI